MAQKPLGSRHKLYPKKSKSASTYRRKFKAVSLSSTLKSVVGKEFKRRGFAVSEMITRWPHIIGSEISSYTCPDKLSFQVGRGDGGTLTLKVAPAFATTVSHLEPLIVDKINTYFGHACVGRLRIIQGPLPLEREVGKVNLDPDNASQGVRQQVDQQVAMIQDSDLQKTLSRLGRLVHMKKVQKN